MKTIIACFTQKTRFREHDEVRRGDEEGEQYKLHLHRGAFEPLLSDEDIEQDPDRWCSHSAWGQECWQLIAQWVCNLRLELGHQLHPDPVRTAEFAPALLSSPPHTAPATGYAPTASRFRMEGRSRSSVRILRSSPMERFAAPQTKN